MKETQKEVKKRGRTHQCGRDLPSSATKNVCQEGLWSRKKASRSVEQEEGLPGACSHPRPAMLSSSAVGEDVRGDVEGSVGDDGVVGLDHLPLQVDEAGETPPPSPSSRETLPPSRGEGRCADERAQADSDGDMCDTKRRIPPPHAELHGSPPPP